ncbi:uncharacterized protein G2W53_042028 [Senna tora]|uniref:Uncharacterized protein n=1 Tax=Senna tora TaxID=362788 RepID=A0A834SG99_9FABA|nr:uncharacterized protein G2W53_042028 [Senna tora]
MLYSLNKEAGEDSVKFCVEDGDEVVAQVISEDEVGDKVEDVEGIVVEFSKSCHMIIFCMMAYSLSNSDHKLERIMIIAEEDFVELCAGDGDEVVAQVVGEDEAGDEVEDVEGVGVVGAT